MTNFKLPLTMNFIRSLWRRLDQWVARALEPEFEASPIPVKAEPPRHPPHHPRVS